MTTKQPPDPQWLQRLQTVSKAQERYLWILLVVMIFYAALHRRASSATSVTPMKVPIVDLDIDRGVVLAFGPAIISFLALVVLGTMRAYRTAQENLGVGGTGEWSGEGLDVAPNAIDLAFYTTRHTLETFVGRTVVTVVHFLYAAFLAGALVEAAGLAWSSSEALRLVDGPL